MTLPGGPAALPKQGLDSAVVDRLQCTEPDARRLIGPTSDQLVQPRSIWSRGRTVDSSWDSSWDSAVGLGLRLGQESSSEVGELEIGDRMIAAT